MVAQLKFPFSPHFAILTIPVLTSSGVLARLFRAATAHVRALAGASCTAWILATSDVFRFTEVVARGDPGTWCGHGKGSDHAEATR